MSIFLDGKRHEPLTAAQKETLEGLRKTGVPRYLFRGWHLGSGGGQKETINSVKQIVPHGFMKGREGHEFYKLTESQLKNMLECHYDGDEHFSSEFSSWAASLMMTLLFAKRQHNLGYKVWHAPHLHQEEFVDCIHEYFAHGPIRGPGYKAVSYDALQQRGVEALFPELLEVEVEDLWGDKNRAGMFAEDPTVSHTGKDLDSFHSLAKLFHPFEMPVATALACARPRPWYYLGQPGRLDATARMALVKEAVYFNMHYPQPADVHTAHWLCRGSVLTGPAPADDFPDVRQWIDLLRVMAEKVHEQETHAAMRGQKRKEVGAGEDGDGCPGQRKKTRDLL